MPHLDQPCGRQRVDVHERVVRMFHHLGRLPGEAIEGARLPGEAEVLPEAGSPPRPGGMTRSPTTTSNQSRTAPFGC